MSTVKILWKNLRSKCSYWHVECSFKNFYPNYFLDIYNVDLTTRHFPKKRKKSLKKSTKKLNLFNFLVSFHWYFGSPGTKKQHNFEIVFCWSTSNYDPSTPKRAISFDTSGCWNALFSKNIGYNFFITVLVDSFYLRRTFQYQNRHFFRSKSWQTEVAKNATIIYRSRFSN